MVADLQHDGLLQVTVAELKQTRGALPLTHFAGLPVRTSSCDTLNIARHVSELFCRAWARASTNRHGPVR